MPTAGASVGVTVLTFSATQSVCWDDPRITPIPASTWYGSGSSPINLGLELVVLNSSQRFSVPLVQRRSNGAYWDGTLTFPSGGEWQLYAKEAQAPPDPTTSDRCTGSVSTVEVLPLTTTPSPATMVGAAPRAGFRMFQVAIVLAVLAAAGVGAALLLRIRR
jgi:hypothetical protein